MYITAWPGECDEEEGRGAGETYVIVSALLQQGLAV
jgi:hypothetical protein